jgi:hypothetical protein
MSKVQNKNWRMDNMRLGDLEGMQYLINQLKKYRINEGGGAAGYGLSATMYNGSGGFSSSFISPASIPTSNTVGPGGLNIRQNQNHIQISKVTIQNPEKKPIVI